MVLHLLRDLTEVVLAAAAILAPHLLLRPPEPPPPIVQRVESPVDLSALGPLVERAPEFPERINAHFARVDGRRQITVRTWERGSGPTHACGTGACAVCVAGAVTGRTEREVTVTLPGGDLDVRWADDDHVHLTGPAEEVFTGEWRR